MFGVCAPPGRITPRRGDWVACPADDTPTCLRVNPASPGGGRQAAPFLDATASSPPSAPRPRRNSDPVRVRPRQHPAAPPSAFLLELFWNNVLRFLNRGRPSLGISDDSPSSSSPPASTPSTLSLTQDETERRPIHCRARGASLWTLRLPGPVSPRGARPGEAVPGPAPGTGSARAPEDPWERAAEPPRSAPARGQVAPLFRRPGHKCFSFPVFNPSIPARSSPPATPLPGSENGHPGSSQTPTN